jgi:hypothetical protein
MRGFILKTQIYSLKIITQQEEMKEMMMTPIFKSTWSKNHRETHLSLQELSKKVVNPNSITQYNKLFKVLEIRIQAKSKRLTRQSLRCLKKSTIVWLMFQKEA